MREESFSLFDRRKRPKTGILPNICALRNNDDAYAALHNSDTIHTYVATGR
jgi:hypothetical protein